MTAEAREELRDALARALREGRTREATRLAGKLARGGAWDRLVAATLVAYARPDLPEREMAARWMEVPLGAADLEGDLRSAEGWTRLLQLLGDAGRVEEARVGLRLAGDEGLIDAGVWLRWALHLYAAGEQREAFEIVEEAVPRHPDHAPLWSVAALLRLEHGLVEEAAMAAVRALELDADAPAAHLTLAAILAGAGETAAAAAELEAARRAGAPESVVARYASGCGLD